jgi:UDP-N-acetylglucosamine acyltransferase
MEGARIGKIVIYSPVISAVPQDLKFGGEDSLAIIGDNCTIRECVTNRGTIASGQTTLGKIA